MSQKFTQEINGTLLGLIIKLVVLFYSKTVFAPYYFYITVICHKVHNFIITAMKWPCLTCIIIWQ